MKDLYIDIHELKGELKVSCNHINLNETLLIQYDVYSLERERDIFVKVNISKMGLPIREYIKKMSGERLNGSILLNAYELKLLDETRLVGEFKIDLVAKDIGGLALLDSVTLIVEPRNVEVKSYRDFSTIIGSNYCNSSAVNEIQMWTEFNEDEIGRELTYAEDIGLNSLRVFLHNYPYDKDKVRFLNNVDRFLGVCTEHGIRPIFIFFDDCWYGDDRVFNFEPISGDHNGRWAKCPLYDERVITNYPKFRAYIQDTIDRFKEDPRILAWEIWNEPKNCGTGKQIVDVDFTQDLMVNGFNWAREIRPNQPIISCWDGNVYGDIDDQHNYSRAEQYSPGSVGVVVDLERGTLVTEAGARAWEDEQESYGSPIEWIHWLQQKKEQGLPRPGVYLTWELMVGNSNCKWHWSSKPGDPEPSIPWCGIFYPDGTPVSIAETEAIRRYAKGVSKAVLFSDFHNESMKEWTIQSGEWKVVGSGNIRELSTTSGDCDNKIFAGNENWKNYMVQASVMLRGDINLDAGIMVRASWIGREHDNFTGYYCGFNVSEAFIIKYRDGKSENLITGNVQNIGLNVRNSLKVTVNGDKISLFLNNPVKPILEFCDRNHTILSGGIGLRAVNSNATFDDIAVIPV